MRFLTTTLALASSARGFASQSHRSFVSSIHQALRMSESSVSISDGFDGGNIKFVEVVDEGNITKVILRIKPDPYVPCVHVCVAKKMVKMKMHHKPMLPLRSILSFLALSFA